jgi:hypothetical protein
MKQITVVLAGGLLLIALTAGATQQIAMSVSPRVALEPTDLYIRVVAERHADNRLLRVVTASDEFGCSSDRQLDGEDGPRVVTFQCRRVPAGVYEIRAMVIGLNGRPRAQARTEVTVMGRAHDH